MVLYQLVLDSLYNLGEKMKIKLIAILVVFLIVMLGFFSWNYFNKTSYWETDMEFGTWQDEVMVEYEDGTTKSLKLIEEPLQLSYYVGSGEKVTRAWIELSAKVTGSGYDGATVDSQGFGYQRKVWKVPSNELVHIGPVVTTGKELNIPIGSTKDIYDGSSEFNYFDTLIGDEPDGNYLVTWTVNGNVRYKPYPGYTGEWIDCTNPPNRNLALVKYTAPSGEIVVTITSDAGGA